MVEVFTFIFNFMIVAIILNLCLCAIEFALKGIFYINMSLSIHSPLFNLEVIDDWIANSLRVLIYVFALFGAPRLTILRVYTN